MTSRIAAWLRVTPAPSTLSESRAVYKALSSTTKSKVLAFTRCQSEQNVEQTFNNGKPPSATYYTLLNSPHTLVDASFSASANHDLLSPRDEDPFNIRGLQDRKPHPQARTFQCFLQYENGNRQNTLPNLGGLFSSRAPMSSQSATPTDPLANRYQAEFHTKKSDWLQELLGDIQTPAGLRRGLGTYIAVEEEDDTTREHELGKKHVYSRSAEREKRSINMGSLMEAWSEATRTGTKVLPGEIPLTEASRRSSEVLPQATSVIPVSSAESTVSKPQTVLQSDAPPPLSVACHVDEKSAGPVKPFIRFQAVGVPLRKCVSATTTASSTAHERNPSDNRGPIRRTPSLRVRKSYGPSFVNRK